MTGKIVPKMFGENATIYKAEKQFYFQKVDRWKRPRANGWILLYGGPAGSGSAKTESTPATLWPEASAAVGPYLVSRKNKFQKLVSAVHSSRCIIHLRAAQKLFARKQHIHHQNDDDGDDDDDVPINARKNVFLFFPPRRLEREKKRKKKKEIRWNRESARHLSPSRAAPTLFAMDDDCNGVIKKTGTTGSKLY